MKTMRSVLMSAAMGGALLTAATLPALSKPDHPTHPGHGAPGPLVGAGLPFAVVGLGAVWLLRRRRRSA
jgi:hypothetical protein